MIYIVWLIIAVLSFWLGGLDGLILSVLAYCVTCNKSDRLYVALCVFWLMVASALFFETPAYNSAVGFFGIHVYNSLLEMVLVLLLALRASKLGVMMIGVGTLAVFINVLSYWVGLYGDSTVFFEVCMYPLLLIQIALLLSRRLTDGLHEYIAGFSVFRADRDSVHQRISEGEGK
jgi:hypothetical protein